MNSMRDVHLRQVDLNLLSTLYALLEERHVTRAAKRCFLSQPAMSRSLERIRDTFGDELLIRDRPQLRAHRPRRMAFARTGESSASAGGSGPRRTV